MQDEMTSSDGVTITDSKLSQNPFLSPKSQISQFHPTSPFHHSSFPPNSSSFTISPSEFAFDDEDHVSNAIAPENRLNQTSFILEYQQLYNCYTFSLASLQDAIKEVDALRQTNDTLRLANTALVQQLTLLSPFMCPPPSPSIIDDFRRLTVGNNRRAAAAEEASSVSPTSVIERNRIDRRNSERSSMPKSISVRSSGYLRSSHGANRFTNPSPGESRQVQQRVHVPGGKNAAEALEFEVYNQGMSKTELCNKWQETGACPYGDNCQFAHGISELRPVIRHPRYKTEVCRLVLDGNTCPYGHRCHFRHSLTDQELLMRAPR